MSVKTILLNRISSQKQDECYSLQRQEKASREYLRVFPFEKTSGQVNLSIASLNPNALAKKIIKLKRER